MRSYKAALLLMTVLYLEFEIGVSQIYADPLATTACSAVATPSYREANQNSVEFFFAVTNQSYSAEVPTADMDLIRIEPPSGVTIVGAGADVSSGNFLIDESGVEFEIDSEAMPRGSTASFRTVVNVGEGGALGGDFVVKGMSALDETGQFADCAMSVDMPPTLSSVSYSIQSESTVLVSWTTNESATSQVEYGTNSGEYPYQGGDSSMTTAHAVTLSGLVTQTTYYFRIASTDGTGNTTYSQAFSLTMPAPGGIVTETVTLTVTNTVTQTTTNTNTNTVVRMLVDATPPKVTLTNTWEKFYAKGPTIIGKASDNKSVVAVDYSVDKGKTWRPVEIESRKSSVNFSIDLPIEEEGNYDFLVRAYDAEGNRGTSKSHTIVIDRLPPLFGAAYLSWGPGLSVPTNQERVTTMAGLPLTLTLGAVGGPTNVTIGGLDAPYTLYRDQASGRWTGTLLLSSPGNRAITAAGVDGSGQTTTSNLFQVDVLSAGKVTNAHNEPLSANVTVMARNAVTGVFSLWDGAPFGRENPIIASDKGEFGLVLPPGTYYLQIQATSYKKQVSDMFTLTNTGLVRATVVMKPRTQWSIGQWKVYLPDWSRAPFTVEVAASVAADEMGVPTRKELWGQLFPEMEFKSEAGESVTPADWLGQATVLLLDAPWLPTTAQSIASLHDLATSYPKVRTVWVASQQGVSVLQGIRARAGDAVSHIVADDAAMLTEYLGIHQLPVSVIIDRMGMVRGIYRGMPALEAVAKIMEE